MMQPKPKPYLWRSLLFVPGHVERMLHRALLTEADALILDLEDAVPDEHKIEARRITRKFLAGIPSTSKTIFVRTNSYETGLTSEDLNVVICAQVDGILYPWANDSQAIQRLEVELTDREKDRGLPFGHVRLIALLETSQAILHAEEIARASKRLVGLLFGCEDFLAELEGVHDAEETALLTPRAWVAMAARAAGLQPLDTPYIKIREVEGLRRFAQTGRALGMSGMSALTPMQAKIINEVYTPTVAEVKAARETIKYARTRRCQDRGVCVVGDKFVSPPTVKAARKLVRRAQALRRLKKSNHA